MRPQIPKVSVPSAAWTFLGTCATSPHPTYLPLHVRACLPSSSSLLFFPGCTLHYTAVACLAIPARVRASPYPVSPTRLIFFLPEFLW